MAALRAGFAERARRPRADPRPDLQARRHAGGLGGAGRLGAPAQELSTQGCAPRATSSVCDAIQRIIQRYTHGIGMTSEKPMKATIERHSISRPVPLRT